MQHSVDSLDVAAYSSDPTATSRTVILRRSDLHSSLAWARIDLAGPQLEAEMLLSAVCHALRPGSSLGTDGSSPDAALRSLLDAHSADGLIGLLSVAVGGKSRVYPFGGSWLAPLEARGTRTPLAVSARRETIILADDHSAGRLDTRDVAGSIAQIEFLPDIAAWLATLASGRTGSASRVVALECEPPRLLSSRSPMARRLALAVPAAAVLLLSGLLLRDVTQPRLSTATTVHNPTPVRAARPAAADPATRSHPPAVVASPCGAAIGVVRAAGGPSVQCLHVSVAPSGSPVTLSASWSPVGQAAPSNGRYAVRFRVFRGVAVVHGARPLLSRRVQEPVSGGAPTVTAALPGLPAGSYRIVARIRLLAAGCPVRGCTGGARSTTLIVR